MVDGLLFSLPALLQTRWLSMRRHWSDVRFCLLRFGRVGGYRCAVPGQTCAFIFGASADLATFCAAYRAVSGWTCNPAKVAWLCGSPELLGGVGL